MPKPLPVPRVVWQSLFWLQIVVVTALMLLPRPPPLIDTGWDKLNHLLAFAGPMFAGLAALPRHRWAAICWLALGLLAWGAALELAQGWLPPRTASLADLLADAVGMLLGAAFYALVWRWVRTAPN